MALLSWGGLGTAPRASTWSAAGRFYVGEVSYTNSGNRY